MDNHRPILRKTGIVLVVLGLVDIGFMIYCIATGKNYSSSLNIFAVIAGVFLIRGSLAAARVVTWFTAFLLAALFAGMLVVFPLTMSVDLWLTEFRLNPTESLLIWGFACLASGTLAWVYLQLRSPNVVGARVEAGHSSSPPRSAFALGITLAVGIGMLLHFIVHGEDGAKAVEIARAQNGPNYKYVVTQMHSSTHAVRATVTAYNDGEVKSVDVEWQR